MRRFFLTFLFFLFLSYFAGSQFFKVGFFDTQDNMHPLRLLQYEECQKDGQFPCRYVQQLGLNCGYPLFNFYPPASYEFALGIKTLFLGQMGYLSTIKAYYLLTILLGSIGMFFLSKHISKNQYTAFLAATLYTLAPYRSVNIYVRGAFAEHFLLSTVPWLIFFLLSWSNSFVRRLLYILTLCLTILSHSLFPILFGPIFIVFLICKLTTYKQSWSSKGKLLLDTFFSLLLSSFFLLPALLERKNTTNHLMSTGYFSFINHFVTFKQLFLNAYWGYGPSTWGNLDGMSFQIGPIHLLAITFCLISFFIGKSIKRNSFFVLIGLSFFIFLTHNRSTFFWQALPFMSYVQFPWRFLGPIIFLVSILVSIKIKGKYITFFLILSCLIFYSKLFYSNSWNISETDQVKFSGAYLYDQQAAGLSDYWPSYGQVLPTVACQNIPTFTSGQGNVEFFSKKTNRVVGKVFSNGNSTITLPLVFFPGWQVSQNGAAFTSPRYEPKYGLITLNLQPGENNFVLVYVGTKIQQLSDLLSLFSLGALLYYLIISHGSKNN